MFLMDSSSLSTFGSLYTELVSVRTREQQREESKCLLWETRFLEDDDGDERWRRGDSVLAFAKGTQMSHTQTPKYGGTKTAFEFL